VRRGQARFARLHNRRCELRIALRFAHGTRLLRAVASASASMRLFREHEQTEATFRGIPRVFLYRVEEMNSLSKSLLLVALSRRAGTFVWVGIAIRSTWATYVLACANCSGAVHVRSARHEVRDEVLAVRV
jgi:hypothetical protein